MPKGIFDVSKLFVGERVKHIRFDGSTQTGTITRIEKEGLFFCRARGGKKFVLNAHEFIKGHAGRCTPLRRKKK